MELSQLPLVFLLISIIHSGQTEEKPKPSAIIKPAQHVFRGETVTLRCDIYAEGVTSWRYFWYKEGLNSVFSDRQEHTFSSVTESDAGKYSCDGFKGSDGSHRSDTVTLTVSGVSKPTLTVHAKRSVFTGDSVTLRCEGIQSQNGWEFLWRKDSNPESTGAETKTINPVTVSDGGEYSCRARKGGYYTDYSEPAAITIYERPKPSAIIKPAQHVFRGETVTLRCDIYDEGVTSWSYRWYKEGSTSVFSDRQEHTFSSVTESDAGKYSCKGSETGGSRWSQTSDKVTLTVSGVSKPALTVEPQSSVFTGDSVTLRCEGIQSQNGWEFLWRKDSNRESTGAETKTINPVTVSDGGEYSCRARRGGYYTDYSKPVIVTIYERPKPKVTIKPAQHVFRRETVTLRCDIYDEGVTSWSYSWYKDNSRSVFNYRQEHTFWSVTESDAGKYSCKGSETQGSRWSQTSDKVTLIVSDPRAVLSVSPQKWFTEGDPVTLICEVHNFSTGWTFSWFTLTESAVQYNLLSDSSRGAGGNYTVSSAVNHTGVYVCRAEREKSVYKTQYSNRQQLWVTGVSPPVSLIVSPSRTQHFTSVSLSLSCEDQSNSTGWRVRRYRDSGQLEDCSSLRRGSQTGSTCTISSTITSDTGVYWCQSESGEKHHPVNITVHSGVILESPVHPVTEGDHLTLRCLYRHSTSPNLRADFYKDGSLIQNQTTEMNITTVSKSHEGFYSCKHPERGASPKSWISVRAPTDSRSDGLKPMIIGVTAGLTLTVFIIVLLLLWRYRNNKGGRSQSSSSVSQQQISSQTSDQNQSEAGYKTLLSGGRSQSSSSVSQQQISSQTSDQNQSEAGYKTLLSGTAQFYDTVYATVNDDSVSESSEHMYAEIELKSTTKQKKNKENETESSDCFYSKLALQTDQGAGSSEVTYVEVK